MSRNRNFNTVRNKTIYQEVQILDSRRVWSSTTENRSKGNASVQNIHTPLFSHLHTRSHWKSMDLF